MKISTGRSSALSTTRSTTVLGTLFTTLFFATAAQATQANQADNTLSLYSGHTLPGGQVTIVHGDRSKQLTDRSAELPSEQSKDDSIVAVRKSAPNALTLRFKNAGFASLRIDSGKPADLRPYLTQGVLAFDLNVSDMARGGVNIVVGCGDEKCNRNVPYVLPARAQAGKGWQHLEFSMSCFVRKGDDFSAVERPFMIEANGSGTLAVAKVRFLRSGKPNASCPDYRTVSVTPDKLNENWSIPWWTPRHEKKLQEAQALGKSAQVVFIGDSITHGWEEAGAPVWQQYYAPLNALDLGFGGDRTENVLWRLQHGEVDAISPKVAVLMFGTNNAGHRQEDPATTAAGIRRNIDELRQRLPNTKILLLAIFPRGATPNDEMRQINDKVNRIIAGYADNEHITFLDLSSAFLAADGTLSRDIMPDLLHPNVKGYEIWARSMAPTLQRLLTSAP